MVLSGEIGPLNLISGAMIAQFSLMIILFISELCVRSHQDPIFDLVTIFLISIISLALLGMSDVFTGVWGPLFGGLSGWIEWKSSMFYFFLLDISLASFLVFITGGSDRSPYQSIYFLIPTLAIFLRESVKHVIIYTILTILSFTVCMSMHSLGFGSQSLNSEYKIKEFRLKRQLATWLVSIACFLIAVIVGLATRPH